MCQINFDSSFQILPGAKMLKQEVSEPAESYKCSVCFAIFSDVQLFVEHVTHGHDQTKVLADPESLLRCPSCPLSFDRTQYLREHMENIHQSTPTFSIQGSDCFLNFRSTVFNNNYDTIISAQPIISRDQTTPVSQASESDVSASASLIDGLYCNQCKNPFANKYSLMKHLRSTKCKLDSEASINRVINDQLTCNKCRHQFGSVQALKKHVEGLKCMVKAENSASTSGLVKCGLVFDESIQLTPYATGMSQIFVHIVRQCAQTLLIRKSIIQFQFSNVQILYVANHVSL